MEFVKKDLADIQLDRVNDLFTLTMLRSRGPAFEGGQDRLDRISAGLTEARAIAYLFTAIQEAVIELREENAKLRARIKALEPKPAKASAKRKAVA